MIGQGVVKVAVAVGRKSLIQIPKRTMYPQMSSNILSGVPRNRVPFLEKVAAGIFIALSVIATPAYIMSHMDNYRTLEKPEMD